MRRLTIALLLAILALPGGAVAQKFPERPITVVNPYAAGGPADLIARTIAARVSEIIGKPVVVENRPGGGATIGAAYVAKANPDGYTLFIGGSPSHAISPALMSNVTYDGVKDFAPVAMVAVVSNLIAVNSESPLKSIQDLVAAAKKEPGKLTFGTAGVGSLGQFAGELLKQQANIDMVHVPYQGGGPVVVDLLANNITTAIINVPPAVPQIQAGKLRALAVTTKVRAQQIPDVPTLNELGFSGFDIGTWYGISAPAGTPKPVIDTLYAAIAEAMKSEAVLSKLKPQGVDVFLQTPAEFGAYLKDDADKMVRLIKAAGLKRN